MGAPSLPSPPFFSECPSRHNPPNLSWLRTGAKYAGLHIQWLGWLDNLLNSVKFSLHPLNFYCYYLCTINLVRTYCMSLLHSTTLLNVTIIHSCPFCAVNFTSTRQVVTVYFLLLDCYDTECQLLMYKPKFFANNFSLYTNI